MDNVGDCLTCKVNLWEYIEHIRDIFYTTNVIIWNSSFAMYNAHKFFCVSARKALMLNLYMT